MFSLIYARIKGWVNNGEAGDLRRSRAHSDVTVMASTCYKMPQGEYYLSCPMSKYMRTCWYTEYHAGSSLSAHMLLPWIDTEWNNKKITRAIYHNVTHSTAMTAAEQISAHELTNGTQYLALAGEPWVVNCEGFGENWRRYNALRCILPRVQNVVRHYSDVIMGTITSQITSLTSAYSTVYLIADQRKLQSSASLAFVWGIHRWPVISPHKGPVTRKMFPFDDVIMAWTSQSNVCVTNGPCWQSVIKLNWSFTYIVHFQCEPYFKYLICHLWALIRAAYSGFSLPHFIADKIIHGIQALYFSVALSPLLVDSRDSFTHTLQKLLGWHPGNHTAWWRHEMETFSASPPICAGNSQVTCELPTQRPVTRSFDVFFDLRLNKRLSKQRWGWWFQTPSRPLWRQCNGLSLV